MTLMGIFPGSFGDTEGHLHPHMTQDAPRCPNSLRRCSWSHRNSYSSVYHIYIYLYISRSIVYYSFIVLSCFISYSYISYIYMCVIVCVFLVIRQIGSCLSFAPAGKRQNQNDNPARASVWRFLRRRTLSPKP